MKTRYTDLIEQTFYYPQEEFETREGNLFFHGIDMMQIIEEHGTPLKFNYIPKISENILKAKKWFGDAFKKLDYKGKYHYCYCTKSSHFKFVFDEALKNDIHVETSSAFDIDIIKTLKKEGKITDKTYVVCNGFKRDEYIKGIADLINSGQKNCIPVIDNYAFQNDLIFENRQGVGECRLFVFPASIKL